MKRNNRLERLSLLPVPALASPNRVVRKQVLELLSAVCVYAPGGQALALDALDHLRASTGREHRFSVLVDELSHPEVLPYAATVLAFINCVLISTDEFRERLRLRNQLLGEYVRSEQQQGLSSTYHYL